MAEEVGLFHLWNHCGSCGQAPIFGKRFECQTCPLGPDSDLCGSCYERFQKGQLEHPSADNFMAAHLRGQTHHFLGIEGRPVHNTSAWFEVPQVNDAVAPRIVDGFVVRPEFCAGYESTFAGYSFVVHSPKDQSPLLLTALHVMDEMLRKKNIDASAANLSYTGEELPRVISKVNLYNVFAANWMVTSFGEAAAMLVLPGARIKDEEPLADRDIAAFTIDQLNPDLRPGNLAKETPNVGEAVWLVANRGTGQTARTIKAVVVHKDERSFIFRYETPKIPSYTSGAPLMNARGEVVGINVGGGDFHGQRFGHANHVESIRRHLRQARSL